MKSLRVLGPAVLALLVVGCKDTATAPPDAGVPPAAPTGVQAAVAAGVITVSWTSGSSDQTEFVVARAIVAQAMSQPAQTELQIIGSTGPTLATYEDRDVEPGHFYVYGIAARGPGGRSALTLQSGDAVSLTAMGSSCQGTVTAEDSDGDGLSDADENSGWMVLVDEDGKGTISSRLVKSGPFAADTDGDGLCDGEESALKTDPRQADTDGDGLSDFQEVNRWGSSPTNVDSDGDAQGNSNFYDGSELLNFGTSPTLADTDGDGRTDFEEINQNGTNPLVAELPMPKLNIVSAMDLGINVTLENGTVVTDAVTHAFEEGTSSALTQTSSTANQQSLESSYSVTVESSVGFPESGSVKATGTYSQKEGYVQETSSSFSRQSQSSAQQSFEQLSSDAVSKNETITGGHIALDFQIENQGTRSFQLSSVVVTALKRDRDNPTTFSSIATLAFPSTADTLVLAEGQSTGPLRAQADISANVALDLLANPGAVFFRTANFSLTDRTGTAFAFSVGEETSSRTALLTIDYGGVRPLERYRVATNVERTSNGKAAGVRLGDALQRILGLAPGVGYQTQNRAGAGGKKIITRVRDVAAQPSPDGGTERFWVAIAPENPDPSLTTVSDRVLSKTIDVEDAVLMPRDSLTLAFVADHDGDGLYEREELMYGTYDAQVDSDGDGLTDFQEVREGWTVPVDNAWYRAHPRVFSIPTAVDADGDGWNDAVEKMHGTDPNRKDTDGDGLADNIDPAPTKGPSGEWLKLLGTAGDEVALQVVAGDDTVWVLGTSTGDIDADSVVGGPFVMALDAATGAVKWTKQLEGTTSYSKKIVADAAGTVWWATQVKPSVLTGVTTDALYLVKITKAGVATATDLTNVPSLGATTLARNTIDSAEPQTGGGFVTFGSYLNLVAQNTISTLGFDANGAFNGGSSYHGNAGQVPKVVETATTGVVSVASIDWTSGCAVDIYRAGSPQGTIGFCGASIVGRPVKVALDHQSAVYAAVNTGTKDRLDRLTMGGSNVWSRSFAADFTLPRVTALDVDATDQVFIGLQDTGKPAALEVITTSGARLGLFSMGNATTRLTSSRRDAVGNLYLTGTTTGGFDPGAAPLGGTDVVLSRNPQLTFAP